ncbi:Scramblase-domain-containing protein [Cytidiella melzeri]|nr:Scramblase-domain-containing protein [Cytidiella melzeri]
MLARILRTTLPATILQTGPRSLRCATQASSLAYAPTLSLVRGYAARSRYPEKTPGTSRTREWSQRPLNRKSQQERASFVNVEQQPSAEESPLWEASKRPPASDPQEGLRKLLLEHDMLVVTRQIEMLNIFIGFEQSNKYVISNKEGETLGYIAEEPRGFFSMYSRQLFRTHRPFRAVVMDIKGSPILWMRRPFAWLTSRLFVQRLKDYNEYTPEGDPVLDTFGEAHQKWHLWRRRYQLFLKDTPHRILTLASEKQPEPTPEESSFTQLANIDEGLLAWLFILRDARGEEIASINKAFRGVGREVLTDTGQYVVRFEPTPPDPDDPRPRKPYITRQLTVDERALILAMAVNVDFDYFSRHSRGGLHWPLLFFAATE